jgi:hypothetical protein
MIMSNLTPMTNITSEHTISRVCGNIIVSTIGQRRRITGLTREITRFAFIYYNKKKAEYNHSNQNRKHSYCAYSTTKKRNYNQNIRVKHLSFDAILLAYIWTWSFFRRIFYCHKFIQPTNYFVNQHYNSFWSKLQPP